MEVINKKVKNDIETKSSDTIEEKKINEKIDEILSNVITNPSIRKEIENAIKLDENVEINSLIFKSQKYDALKTLTGNRELNKANLKKLEESIVEYGYRESQPITINKNAEIINGQHRNHICKKLNLPIFFNFEDCETNSLDVTVKMNISQKNWGILDFIKSHADLKNENYINFLDLMDSQKISPSLILWLLYHSRNGDIQAKVKEGDLRCSKSDVERVKKTIALLHEIQNVIPDTLPADRAMREAILSDKLAVPLAIIMEEENYTHSRMLKQISNYYHSIDKRNMSSAGDTLVKIYNFRLRESSKLKAYSKMDNSSGS